jgi:Tfp pilus assembly protein PilV
MVALLLGSIGLLGTLAVQQAVITASKNANDATVALRLATQQVEEFGSYLTTGDPNQNGNIDQFLLAFENNKLVNNVWTAPEFLNAEGRTAAAANPEFRWARRSRVTDLGPNLPYVISVVVTYRLDTAEPRTVRLDIERRKSW